MQRLLTPMLALLALLTLTPMVQAQSSYKISPGDVLQLEVLEDPALNRNLLVLPDGTVTIPSGGTIRAAGHTIPEVQAAVVQNLTPGFAKPPTVNLAVGQLAQKTASGTASRATVAVYAMGEVTKPGRLDVEPGTTLLQFLAQSGGFTNFAATKRIQLRRTDASGHEQVFPFNYEAVLSGRQSAVLYLQKGDVIVVPQRHLFE
ncbi:MAG: polysaccharide biosynthesis/export family protein [Cypionkella sp.]